MNRRYLTFLFCFAVVSVTAQAQDMYYGEMLSVNNYYGTARSIAMGNAVTAIGGDQGTININPAGSAVATFSQLTFTPSVVISSTGTSFSPYNDNYSASNRVSNGKFYVPNAGGTILFNTGREIGLKSFTIGILSNMTNTFLRGSTGFGNNSKTSFLGNLAAAAEGMNPDNLRGEFYAAYNANQISTWNGSGRNYEYIGNNEVLSASGSYHYVPGTLNQSASYNQSGYKHDFLFNFGFNVSDVFYFGASLGRPRIRYNREEYFRESVQDGEFPVVFIKDETEVLTEYESSTNEYRLSTAASGVYGKFGFIWLPVGGLRVGAAIQTPTLYTVTENWQYAAVSRYANSTFDGSSRTTLSEYSYNFHTPLIVNAGLAYTFAGMGLVSLDYEMMNYSMMRYSDISSGGFSDNAWYGVNATCNKFCGFSHNIRAGAEYKFFETLSVRLGATLLTCPERYWHDEYGNVITADDYLDRTGMPRSITLVDPSYYKDMTYSVSGGLGYSSPGSFFFDAAFRYTRQPDAYFSPYYAEDYDALDKYGKSLNVTSPRERISPRLYDIVFTIGFRF